MRFVYPEFLWALLALVIPVVIHLFSFRRYKTLYFSNLKFLRYVEQQTKSTQKLKHLIVLLLRMLAFSLLVFAFAQPYFPVEKNGATGGKPVIAIYIDNSFSMTAKGTEGELISEAREFARNTVKKAPLKTSFLIASNELSGTEKRILTQPEALEYLDKIQPGPMVRQVDDVITWMRGVLDNENSIGKAIGSRQYLILSDFQKNTSSSEGLLPDENGYYYPIRFSPQDRSNLYIDSVWFSSPIRRVGTNNELNIRLVNQGDVELTNVEVHFNVDNIRRDLFVDIPANDETVTTINYTDKIKGNKKGKITVNDKQLFWDDDYFFSYSVDDHSDILIINGEDFSPTVERVYLLEPYYRVKSIDQTSFTMDDAKDKELIFLNGLRSVPSGMTEQLISFTESGGSIAIIPGKDIKFNEYQELLGKLYLPYLGRLTDQGTKIQKIEYEDPFFKGMFDKKKKEVNLRSVVKAYSIVRSGNSKHLELLNFQNGLPLFLRANSSVNAFVFTVSVTPDFGTFSSESLYPSILLRIGELSQKKAPIALTLGSDAHYPLYDKQSGEDPIHLKDGKTDFIPKTEKRGLLNYILLNGLEAVEYLKSGNYKITGEGINGILSLNYSREESQTEYVDINEMSSRLMAAGLKNVSSSEIDRGQSLAKIDIDKPFEYWRLFIILALVFLIAEMLVLKLWK